MITVRGGKVLHTTLGRVLVKLSKPEKVTSSGIIIPDSAKKQTDFVGEVFLVSRSDTFNKVGDKVVVRKHSGIKIETDDNEEYRLYDKTDILVNLSKQQKQ